MRGLWFAGMATASSLTAGAGAAAAAFVPRGLGGAPSRARLVGSRRSRSSAAAAASAATAGFIPGTTSTRARSVHRQQQHQQQQREHVSTLAMALAARRPRAVGQSVFSRSWVAPAGRAGRPSQRMFSSAEWADVGAAAATSTTAEAEEEEEEEEPSPFKVGFQTSRPNVDARNGSMY